MDKYIKLKNDKKYDYNIDIFTDGAVSNNRRGNKNAVGGIGVYYECSKPLKCLNIQEPFYMYPITNQRSELYAMIVGLQNLYINNLPKENTKIRIYTDSMYSINCMTKWVKGWISKGWKKADGKPVLNVDLIYNLYKLINQYEHINVEFIHVPSHKEEPKEKIGEKYRLWYGNNMADLLANNGKKKFK